MKLIMVISPVDDWETGSKGWIVWISLSIMLADAVISLGYIVCRPIMMYGGDYAREAWNSILKTGGLKSSKGYTPIFEGGESIRRGSREIPLAFNIAEEEEKDSAELDAAPEHLVSNRIVSIGLVISIVFCIFGIRVVFGDLIPIYLIVLAVLFALVLSIMGVRALGETDCEISTHSLHWKSIC